jgi:hypothetical protein
MATPKTAQADFDPDTQEWQDPHHEITAQGCSTQFVVPLFACNHNLLPQTAAACREALPAMAGAGLG